MCVICGMTCKVRNVLSSSKEAESFSLLDLSVFLASFTYFVFKFGRPSAFQKEMVYGVREGTVYGVMDGERFMRLWMERFTGITYLIYILLLLSVLFNSVC